MVPEDASEVEHGATKMNAAEIRADARFLAAERVAANAVLLDEHARAGRRIVRQLDRQRDRYLRRGGKGASERGREGRDQSRPRRAGNAAGHGITSAV